MIKLVCVGKIKDKNLAQLVSDYEKKINHYHKLQIVEVKDVPINNNEEAVKDNEALRVLNQINDDEYVILVDLHGETNTSEEFAVKIDKLFVHYSRITFVIAGSLGFGQKLLSRANYRIKLSDFTFLHQMSRLIILEQIYRSFKILNNETYHK